MIPSIIQNKKNYDTTIQTISKSVEVSCSQCSETYPIEKGFIILFDKESLFKNICSKCAQIRFMGKIQYLEDYNTFAKRNKVGYFKDWKVGYNAKD